MVIGFQRVEVYHQVHGGTLVTWGATPAALPPGVVFRVWYSDSGVGDWQLVGTVLDGMALVDPKRRQYAVDTRVAYRVEAEYDGATAMSNTVYAGGMRGAHNSTLAEAILRKERMLLEKRTGTSGLLWKRRHWGGPCGTCIDPDTGEPRNSQCPECFGTGITRGYFPAVDYVMGLGASRARKLVNTDQGVVGPVQITARALPCPRLDTGDVWASCASDERWIVGGVRETLFQGALLLYEQVELSMAPASDVVYRLPAVGGGPPAGELLLDAGRLMLYDEHNAAFYPVGVSGQSFSVFAAPDTSYRLQDSKLQLRDVASGVFYAIGLANNELELYTSTADAPAVDISHGRLRIWDSVAGAYRRIGLAAGVFTVYEEST